jgi:hypothetical protein
VYAISRANSDNSENYFTRMIAGATAGLHDEWTAQNDLHVRMIEQAGEDRVLFQKTRPQEHVEMKFPEYVHGIARIHRTDGIILGRRCVDMANSYRIMNAGSPYNVPAGSQVSMEKVIEKYRKINNDENERKLENLRNNRISSEQPFESKTRVKKAPAAF